MGFTIDESKTIDRTGVSHNGFHVTCKATFKVEKKDNKYMLTTTFYYYVDSTKSAVYAEGFSTEITAQELSGNLVELAYTKFKTLKNYNNTTNN